MPDVQETIGTVEEAFSKADLSGGKIFTAVIIFLIGVVALRLLMMIIDRALGRSRLDKSIRQILRGVFRFVLWSILVIVVLNQLDVEVSSLVALLSVAALAVSLALQNLMSNVAGGLQLLSTKPFSPGDFIETGSVMGTVAETGMFYTKLTTPDNKVIQIPNSEISGEKIINYSVEKNRRVEIKVTASYDAPVEQVKACLMEVLKLDPRILDDPAPMARVNSYGESSIEYVVRLWCANAEYWDVYFDVLEAIKSAFDRSGIEMTYNHLNVHMMQGGDGTVKEEKSVSRS